MFTLTPRSVFNWDFDVARAGAQVGRVSTNWAYETGQLEFEGRTFVLGREGHWSGAFFVAHGGGRIATAEKPSAFERRFECELGAEHAAWRAESAFGRAFVLQRQGRVVGALRPTSWLNRACTLELPADLPGEVQLFLAWLALLQWRRAQRH